jgi:hypothetical protein
VAEESHAEGPQSTGPDQARQAPGAAQLLQTWLDATAGFWSTAAVMSAQTAALGGEWLKVLAEAGARGASMALPADPFALLRQWYEAISPASAQAADEMLHSTGFVEAAARFMDLYATAYAVQRRQAEAYLQSLRVPTRSDIARVAGLVVALEEKVDRIEDALADAPAVASATSVDEVARTLEERLSRLEEKVDRLLGAIEALQPREPRRPSRRRPAPASAAEEVGAAPRGRSVAEPAPAVAPVAGATPARRRGSAGRNGTAIRGSAGAQHPAPTRTRRRRGEASDAAS